MKVIIAIRDYSVLTMAIGLALLAFGASVFIFTAFLELLITGDIKDE